jgi:hypothetical protein
VLSRRREFRRVERDQVELAAAVAQFAKLGENVGITPLDPRGVETVVGDVGLGKRERVG